MRITSILSLVGVLGAGSAAAVVNNQVLTNAGAEANAAITVDATAEAATQIQSATLTGAQVMFQVRDAGFVTLDTAGNVMTVVSATANTGWVLLDSLDVAADGTATAAADVVLAFQSTTTDDIVQFTANLLSDGSVATTVRHGDSDDANGTDVSGNGSVGVTGTIGDGGSGVDDANGTDDDCPTDALVSVCADASVEAQVNDD